MRAVVIQELSEAAADSLRRSLRGECLENVKSAFTQEEDRLGGQGSWPLPKDQRIYYLALLDGTPYLLAGINPGPSSCSVNISSVARVVGEPRGQATVCLRWLIEELLVPMCRGLGRSFIDAKITTERARRVFSSLASDRPKGIERIDLDGSSWRAFVRAK
jgi:hypothetical protein